ncbi:RCC1/BLIP-II [Yamadazyma tenuis ATCC 10573]|uniref:RCC1/BLIP-II n=2 Tax=Candida tenuis TaxID=2315449 RepID=G3BFS8_CANTC|nr:RCC1/BLIP-II [Yamadazyma tenuis ATCC 10573]EGV60722.1 RCC1/BLIP-II [Yamadazyma tenuis ATCC 10573]
MNINMLGVRMYAKDSKYRNIDEFNKFKTEFKFGDGVQEHVSEGSNTKEIHSRIAEQQEEEKQQSINELLESDPRLSQLEYGSPEYKEMLFRISEEFRRKERKNRQRYESRERFKAVGYGIAAIVGIASLHQFIFHYQWYKSVFNKSSYDVDESQVKTTVTNVKKLGYMQGKLQQMLDASFLGSVLNSEQNSGLYVFGSHNGSKLPIRIEFFDHMLLKDVQISGDFLVAVADNGKVYQYTKTMKQPELVRLPSKIESCKISQGFVYFLTVSGQVVYAPRPDKEVQFISPQSRNWVGIKRDDGYSSLDLSDFNRGEKVNEMSAGDNHMLLLTNQGRLFNLKTAEGPNYGQFGTPAFAPVKNSEVPVNEVFPLTSLNNELVSDGDARFLRPRTFTHIASGSFHNLASDSNGDIWCWGKNSHGQCGMNVTHKSDVQPIPQKVFSFTDFKKILKTEVLRVEKLDCSEETSYVMLKNKNETDVLLSFGNGIKGQLGISRYLHLSNVPLVVKTLNLKEFNETTNKVQDIGIKEISSGLNHTIVKLDNVGSKKDIMIFGDNEFGQFGNGKLIRSSKPVPIPELIEPHDIVDIENMETMKSLTKRVFDPDNRLSLKESLKINGTTVEQVIKATGNSSVIYYKRK